MRQDLRYLGILIIVLFLGGSLGYALLEDWPIFDAFYMTVITLSTTGFQEIRPMSTAGRLLTIVLIIMGISFLFYFIGRISVDLFEKKVLRGRKMQKQIDRLKDHYIICGFGRMGTKISMELDKRQKDFVILEKEEEIGEEKRDGMYRYDATLIQCGTQPVHQVDTLLCRKQLKLSVRCASILRIVT